MSVSDLGFLLPRRFHESMNFVLRQIRTFLFRNL